MQSFHNFLTAHILTAHIVAIDKTHGQNFLNAGYYFVMLWTAAICTLIHTILPCSFRIIRLDVLSNKNGRTAWISAQIAAVKSITK